MVLEFPRLVLYSDNFDLQAGGVVSSNGRLQGRLEVSRGFGDRQFKKVCLSPLERFTHSFCQLANENFSIA